jgi:acyl-[acyl-carrier-protein]-phospholipid O-acyltransferase/long-chain-fatty-acid--[acyl-carrier-protein] ligase
MWKSFSTEDISTGCIEILRLLSKLYFRVVHRLSIEGMERVPQGTARLIVIANHASYIDGIIIWTYLRLPLRIIVDRSIVLNRWVSPFLKNEHIVPIDSMNPYALKEVIHTVNQGFPLLVFPEGRRTSTGNMMKIYDGAGFVAYKTGATILPIYLKNTYDTFFARKHPGRRIFARLSMTIGEAREPLKLEHLPNKDRKKEATRAIYRALCDIYLEVHNRPSTLGREFVRICKENGGRQAFRDSTGARVGYGKALLGAFALGRYLAMATKGNVGVMLPNLSITAIIFMGLQLFRRVPAFLNYSAGPAALAHTMELADIDTVVTSRQFLEKARIPEAAFAGRKLLFLEEVREQIGVADRLRALYRAFFSGSFTNVSSDEEKATACILFTSGSEGVPKGVCLSHENIITNVYQGLSRVDVTREDYFLNALPIFHSFGLTVGTIIPLFAGARVFFHVSPLHYRIVPELAYDNECTILLATNTFLRGYGKRADPYDFHSMRYVFCGAEALSEAVFQHYAKTFGVRVMSGYGATECSPIVSINSALRHEYGSVGSVLPGIDCRIVPVEGIDDLDGTVGRLFVHGKNVMKGYLKNEAANHKYLVEDGGWYDTGDVVEMSRGGFLRIVGRLKRFAKVSGEMVSLTAIEDVLFRESGGRKDVAVLAVPDERKGEALLVVTNNSRLDLRLVREILKSHGFSDLAVPRDIRFRNEIPKLGTGKTDYVRLKETI